MAPAGERPRSVPRRGARDRHDRDPTRQLAGLAILVLLLLPPEAAGHGPVLCPVRRATGLPCPACGLTRSWSSALHGRLGESLRLHPLGMLALGGAAAYAAGLDERMDPAIRARASDAWPVLVAAWLGAWLVRLAAGTRGASTRPKAARRSAMARRS